MGIIIKKFGGKLLATADLIKETACRVVRARKKEDKIVVVTSAMGTDTEKLIAMAFDITPAPSKKEYDLLLSTGEQLSTALFTMALLKEGVKATFYLGWQARIETKTQGKITHILRIDIEKIKEALEENNIVVIAGFQGVDKENNITTLNRGGSDETAVMLANFLKADRCEIYKDTGGMFTADPNLNKQATLIKEISYNEMLYDSLLGPTVLTAQAIKLAMKHRVVIHIMHVGDDFCGTIISTDPPNRI